jgi:thiosulfate dehydrogenase
MIPRTCLTIILCVLIAAIPVRAQTQDETDIKRGEYVFRISGCGHCHTAEDGEPLAGGRGLETPFGRMERRRPATRAAPGRVAKR